MSLLLKNYPGTHFPIRIHPAPAPRIKIPSTYQLSTTGYYQTKTQVPIT